MTLYFEDMYGVRRKIAEVVDNKDTYDRIVETVREFISPNYKIYYLRCWETENNEICYDFGSHSEFFYLTSD